jgi:diguanylate cyclase (GGDEF)-like protein
MKFERHFSADAVKSALRELPCSAAAYLSITGEVVQFSTASASVVSTALDMMGRTAHGFVLDCRDRSEAVIRNRVREVSGGPLVCRFMVAPMRSNADELIGALITYRAAHESEFTAVEARAAERLAQGCAKTAVEARDPLTGLLTRAGFEREVRGSDALSALLYGDIDQLHVVNDLWGFEIGDRAIASIGARLQAHLQPHAAILCRLSGDRFIALVPNCTLARARQIADQMSERIAHAPLLTEREPVMLTMSWGVALLGETTLDHCLAAAEFACKAAKDRGRNRAEIYQQADESIVKRRADMLVIGGLRSALDAGRFQVFAQPITSLLQGEDTRRYEMLVRILDENDKLVLPQKFMSAATRYQLLPQLDRCVIGHVLGRLKIAAATPGFVPLHVSLNLSGPTISETDFLEWLLNALTDSGIPGEWIGFELTETAAVANLEQAQLLIERVGARGCRFALDDFGTGLSSLAHLKTLNFSIIKIDGVFIRDLLTNPRSESLVRAVAQLANSMGMETVAEYVESAEICMKLIELQVQYGQGYALGRPLPLERVLNRPAALARAS